VYYWLMSTSELERLLRLRKIMKSKKPKFIRMNSWYLTRIGEETWRRPKGLDNKIRLERKGFPARVKIGYRKPKLVRGLHPSGLKEILVNNVADLVGLDPERYAIRIASTVGRRKRREIIKEAERMGLRILNPGR